MLSKPFKSPLLKNHPNNTQNRPENATIERPAKRRRISQPEDSDDDFVIPPNQQAALTVKQAPALRGPLVEVRNPPSLENPKKSLSNVGSEGYYMVLWRKITGKKNKTWEGDGVLAVRSGYATLQDVSGQSLGRKPFTEPLLPGSTLSIGGKDVEIDCTISKEDFLAGRPFLNSKPASKATSFQPPPHRVEIAYEVKPQKLSLQAQMKAAMAKEKEDSKKILNGIKFTSQAGQTAFRNPVKEKTVLPQFPSEKPVPRHDPDAQGALVFKKPKKVPRDRQLVDVVLDPLLGKHLREHQRIGVQFLYECVMGLRDFGGEGCILADEMGLGKTLQTIALIWTLLKQNPIHKADPVIKKALIVCPVTLIDNWRKEFKKWLGNERIGVFVADGTKTRFTDFTMGKTYSVMIIGYERLRSVVDDLTKGSGVDIVIADEGHRLKTEKNKSAKAIQLLQTSRRIILSGTPIQNDLSEFYVMANFVNDGCLGSYKSFVKNFESPILKSRQPDALENDIELGEARSEELAQITSPFILRRTADILSKYLPPKSEYVLFCNPTQDQANIYRHVIGTPMFQGALGNSETALQLITMLKKLCNSPSLLQPKSADKELSPMASLNVLVETFPPSLRRALGNQASTKIRVLDQLLHEIRNRTDEKVILVSNYTSTLDLISNLLASTALPFLRLDGTVAASKRQGIVDDFNRSKSSTCFAFLLSAKAGGMGLNLIGASRLILFDVDWNPATDDQAMARIHRQGQKRHCKIYRFVVKGGLEERIWQRQVVKRGLADSIMDGGSVSAGAGSGGGGKKGVAAFSREELKDLFRLDESEGLRTHDLIECCCDGKGTPSIEESQEKPTDREKQLSIEYLEDSESDRSVSLPDVTSLIKASKLSARVIEEQERRIAAGTHSKQAKARKSQEQEMKALMEYVHLDTSQISRLEDGSDELAQMEDVVNDECLFNVLRQDQQSVCGGIAYLFKKTSGTIVEQTDDGERVPIKKEAVESGVSKRTGDGPRV